MGVPADYKPYATPLWPIPANGGSAADPLYQFYDTNTLWVPMQNGTVQRTAWTGLDPMQNQYILGPMAWNMSASLFKTAKLTERATLRFSMDFLGNVFNMPGLTTPSGSDGVVTTRASFNSPRVLQMTMRLTF
jgi:hypothetical protein